MKAGILRPLLAAGTLALAGACSGQVAPPRAQWKVYLATDAPVPQLGQQVLVELIDDTGNPVSSSLRRLLDGSSDALWPISFGIVPADGAAPPRIHAQLYRLDDTGADGLPTGTMRIDATAVLPASQGEIIETALVLAMSCFGVEADAAGHRTCNPSTGQLDVEPTLAARVDPGTLPQVGSWPPASPVPCSGDPPSGMVCAPGGVFILGSTHFFPVSDDPVPEHLVQLSPFAIDADEVSVGDLRPLVKAGKLAAPSTG